MSILSQLRTMVLYSLPLTLWVVMLSYYLFNESFASDGAISAQKYEVRCKGRDETINLQKAINNEPRLIIDAPGICIISEPIEIPSHRRVLIASETTLHAAVRDWRDRGLLEVKNQSNVIIEGQGDLDGQKASNPKGRLFGVKILDSSHVTIRGLYIHDMPASTPLGDTGGDGIYVGGRSGGRGSTHIIVDGVKLKGNVRQGISLVLGAEIRVLNSQIINTTGSHPGAGIDIEPNGTRDAVQNVIISNNIFEDNSQHIIVSHGGNSEIYWNITIENNIMRRARAGIMTISQRGVSLINNTIQK